MTELNDRRHGNEPVAVDPDGGYHYEMDEGETITEAVISSVSSARGVEPTELEPLYDALDPDALDSVFGPTAAEERRADARAEFSYAGCDVTVYASGRVIVEVVD